MIGQREENTWTKYFWKEGSILIQRGFRTALWLVRQNLNKLPEEMPVMLLLQDAGGEAVPGGTHQMVPCQGWKGASPGSLTNARENTPVSLITAEARST